MTNGKTPLTPIDDETSARPRLRLIFNRERLDDEIAESDNARQMALNLFGEDHNNDEDYDREDHHAKGHRETRNGGHHDDHNNRRITRNVVSIEGMSDDDSWLILPSFLGSSGTIDSSSIRSIGDDSLSPDDMIHDGALNDATYNGYVDRDATNEIEDLESSDALEEMESEDDSLEESLPMDDLIGLKSRHSHRDSESKWVGFEFTDSDGDDEQELDVPDWIL